MDDITVERLILGRATGATRVDEMLRNGCWTHHLAREAELKSALSAEALAASWATVDGHDELLLYAVWFLRLYAQCMWVGPEMDEAARDALPKVLSDRNALPSLCVEGELVENQLELPGALYLGRKFLTHASATSAYALWWRARSAIMLHRSLSGGLQQCLCPELRCEAITAIIRSAQAFGLLPAQFDLEDDRHRSLAAQLDPAIGRPASEPPVSGEERDLMMLEILNILTLYGFGDAFRAYLENEDSLWQHTVALTGRLGIKRAHQADAIPQLSVMLRGGDAERTEASRLAATEVPRDIGVEELDAGTDLLARPKFVDGEESRPLTLTEKFYLLSWASQKMQESVSADALSMSVVVAITAEIVHDGSTNSALGSVSVEEVTSRRENADWALWGSALYLRSRAEFQRSKLKERSCLQILALEEQHSQVSPPPHRRLESLWLTTYPNKWELRREVGRKFRAMGAPLTARDMFAKMHMWTEVIECLLSVNRRNEANDILQVELQRDAESVVLWYLSGDVSGDADHYLKSWRLSGGKFAKAARALGRYYMEKARDRGAALYWFGEAVRIQPYHPATQFTYGCLLMQSGSLKAALTAFNAVICDDEDQFEAWANMGAIHAQLEQWASAKKCLQAAARKAQNRWRIWDSYTKICFKLDDILGAFEGVQRLIELDSAAQIQLWMLQRLVLKVTESRASASKDDFVFRVLQFFKQYFNTLRVPLPSQRNCAEPKTAFDQEPVRTCVDRYRIWAVLTEALHLPAESHEISLKAAREILRVIEDCLSHECPHQLRSEFGSYAVFVESLIKLWARSINELHHYRAVLRESATDLGEFERLRGETTRFIQTSFTRIKAQLNGCSLVSVEDRREITRNLEALEAQAA